MSEPIWTGPSRIEPLAWPWVQGALWCLAAAQFWTELAQLSRSPKGKP